MSVGLVTIGLLSGRVTVEEGYYPLGLQSVTREDRATIPRANVWSCCYLLGYCPVGLLSVGVMSSGWRPSRYCLGTVQASRLQF